MGEWSIPVEKECDHIDSINKKIMKWKLILSDRNRRLELLGWIRIEWQDDVRMCHPSMSRPAFVRPNNCKDERWVRLQIIPSQNQPSLLFNRPLHNIPRVSTTSDLKDKRNPFLFGLILQGSVCKARVQDVGGNTHTRCVSLFFFLKKKGKYVKKKIKFGSEPSIKSCRRCTSWFIIWKRETGFFLCIVDFC